METKRLSISALHCFSFSLYFECNLSVYNNWAFSYNFFFNISMQTESISASGNVPVVLHV